MMMMIIIISIIIVIVIGIVIMVPVIINSSRLSLAGIAFRAVLQIHTVGTDVLFIHLCTSLKPHLMFRVLISWDIAGYSSLNT